MDGVSFNLGVWGYYEALYQKVGINFLARRSWLTMGQLVNKDYPANFELDAGGYMILKTYEKNKNVKVTLKTKQNSQTVRYGNQEYQQLNMQETFIMVPATVKYMAGPRLGIYHRTSPMEFDDLNFNQNNNNYTLNLRTVYGTQAVYAGLFRRSIKNVSVDVEKYGKRGNSGGVEIYFDALLFINSSFKSAMSSTAPNISSGEDVKQVVKDNTKQGIFGFRAGYRIYQVAPKSETGKRFGMCGTFEVGYKPYHGFFANAGLGMTLVKKRPK